MKSSHREGRRCMRGYRIFDAPQSGAQAIRSCRIRGVLKRNDSRALGARSGLQRPCKAGSYYLCPSGAARAHARDAPEHSRGIPGAFLKHYGGTIVPECLRIPPATLNKQDPALRDCEVRSFQSFGRATVSTVLNQRKTINHNA
jgi:hypothetical protein